MNANELADKLQELDSKLHLIELFKSATMLRQQQAEIEELETGLKNVWKVVEGKQTEIDRLNYDLDGFKQNFFVSGFHLQIKMANEQLLKQQEQIDALKSELDRAVELYTDKAIENEALEQQLKKEIQARADALDDLNNRMMKFMKSYNEMAYKLEEVGGAYTHPVKEQDTDCQYCKQGCIRCDARKQLTDEEIQLLINDVRDYDIDTHDLFEFAKAILRKAQEK
jgi:chromosome segregation ATPase